jgi:hypothetical protein
MVRLAGNTPVVIIQQAAEEPELALVIQDRDLHEICELPSECLHVLVESLKIALDMLRNNFFMLLLVNCDLSSAIAPSGSRSKRASAVPTPVFDRAPSSSTQ